MNKTQQGSGIHKFKLFIARILGRNIEPCYEYMGIETDPKLVVAYEDVPVLSRKQALSRRYASLRVFIYKIFHNYFGRYGN